MTNRKLSISEAVSIFLDKNILLSPDIKDYLSKNTPESLSALADNLKGDMLYLNNRLTKQSLKKLEQDLNWKELEKAIFFYEKKANPLQYDRFMSLISGEQITQPEKTNVRVVASYKQIPQKKDVQDFTLHYNARLNALQKILYARDELKNMSTVSRILSKRDRENVSIIAMVKDRQITKNNNIILTVEDSTDEIKVLINKNKPDIYKEALSIVPDEVIGVSGVNGDNIIFANNVLWPDIPVSNQLKKSTKEAYAIFLSDLHIGSDNFLKEDFQRFLSWINKDTGNEKQRELASKVKYIFIVGDLVDGVGIYPGQEEELSIPDIYEQYKECHRLLSQIPSDIDIIICAGNHDATRIAEPQPALDQAYSKILTDLPNVTLVSNPATVNIHSHEGFSGYDVLLYHGYSFDYYVANVDSIRNQGGYDRADLIMKFLLKRRHLAPAHTSTLYSPFHEEDPLVISTVPDFFLTGHIHKSAVANYKNITLISGSCWQSKTAFQEKVGHHPEPSRVPLVNLATRDLKILKFGK
jgi:DNA polymerase II small subunit